MIEEIKNEIIDLTPLFGNKKGVCVLRKEVFEILDKYKDKEIKFENGSSKFAIVKVPKLNVDNIKNYNQPDYKSAWNELKNDNTELIEYGNRAVKDCKLYKNRKMYLLEQKYNLGGE